MAANLTQSTPHVVFDPFSILSFIIINDDLINNNEVESAVYVLKLGADPKRREALRFIMEHDAFTMRVLKERTHLTRGSLMRLVEGLTDNFLIRRVGIVKGRHGSPSPIYLRRGGDPSRIPEAVREHRFLYKDASPVSLEYANAEIAYQEAVSRALNLAKTTSMIASKTVQRSVVVDIFREMGVKVYGFSRVRALLDLKGWRLSE
jgi:DNA-binding transcriptional ArsR family regulator